MADILTKCPICGNEPLAIAYTSIPPKYGFKHCNIHVGSNGDWNAAIAAWNEAVGEYLKGGD